MVEIRCSDRAFASAMTVLVDVLDETFPGLDEMHGELSILQLVFPEDDLSKYTSLVDDADNFLNGTWKMYRYDHVITGDFNHERRVVVLRVQPGIVEKPILAIQELLEAIDFPRADCVLPGCPCKGAGSMLDYWYFKKGVPVTKEGMGDVLNGIAGEWRRRVAMVSSC